MSLAALRHPAADSRAAIVAALEAVDGLTAYPVAPDQATAGAAWPKWIQSTYSGKLCELREDTWEVFAVLPADYPQFTVDEGDQLRDQLAPALLSLGSLEYAEPVAIAFADNQSMPGIRARLITT